MSVVRIQSTGLGQMLSGYTAAGSQGDRAKGGGVDCFEPERGNNSTSAQARGQVGEDKRKRGTKLAQWQEYGTEK